MIGVIINAAGIMAGGIAGLLRKQPLSSANESTLKVLMGAATVIIGLQLTWKNVNGTFVQVLKQIAIVLISMSIGKLLGKALRLQKLSNALGRIATGKLSHVQPGGRHFNEGFIVAALLACANPLGVFAAVHEAISGFSLAFAVKALMDGLAAMAFIAIFGGGVVLAAIPVLAWQGTIVLLVRLAGPFLESHGLVSSILATDGLLVFSAALVILNLKKIELADYLPSLAIAPLITWFWH